MIVGDTVKLLADCNPWMTDDQGEVMKLYDDMALLERFINSPQVKQGIKIKQSMLEVV